MARPHFPFWFQLWFRLKFDFELDRDFDFDSDSLQFVPLESVSPNSIYQNQKLLNFSIRLATLRVSCPSFLSPKRLGFHVMLYSSIEQAAYWSSAFSLPFSLLSFLLFSGRENHGSITNLREYSSIRVQTVLFRYFHSD